MQNPCGVVTGTVEPTVVAGLASQAEGPVLGCRVREGDRVTAGQELLRLGRQLSAEGLSKDEIEKMRKDGEFHAEEDKQRKEELETRNEADNAVYRTEELLKDNADKISANDTAQLETATKAVKEALKGTDATAIKTAGGNLTKTWHVVSAELNKAAGSGPAGARPGNQPGAEHDSDDGNKGEEPVIDAEVVEETHAT